MPGPKRQRGTLLNARTRHRESKHRVHRQTAEVLRRENRAAEMALAFEQAAAGLVGALGAEPAIHVLAPEDLLRVFVVMAGHLTERSRRAFYAVLRQLGPFFHSRVLRPSLLFGFQLFVAVLEQSRAVWRSVSAPRDRLTAINRLATVSNTLAIACTAIAPLLRLASLDDAASTVNAVGGAGACVGALCAASNLATRSVNHAMGTHPLTGEDALRLVGDALSGQVTIHRVMDPAADSMAKAVAVHLLAAPGYYTMAKPYLVPAAAATTAATGTAGAKNRTRRHRLR
jgi:hypothetical protein